MMENSILQQVKPLIYILYKGQWNNWVVSTANSSACRDGIIFCRPGIEDINESNMWPSLIMKAVTEDREELKLLCQWSGLSTCKYPSRGRVISPPL